MNDIFRYCQRCKAVRIDERGMYAKYCYSCSLDAEDEARKRARDKMEKEGLI